MAKLITIRSQKFVRFFPKDSPSRKSHRRSTWHGQPFQRLLGLRDRGATPAVFWKVWANERTPLLNGYLAAEKPWRRIELAARHRRPRCARPAKNFTFGRRL